MTATDQLRAEPEDEILYAMNLATIRGLLESAKSGASIAWVLTSVTTGEVDAIITPRSLVDD